MIMIFQADYRQPVMAHLRHCGGTKTPQVKQLNSKVSNFWLMQMAPKQVMKIQRRYETRCPKIYPWRDMHQGLGSGRMDYSLDGRPGYSSQLIGLSNETDPFLLRHYQYDTRDTFQMIGLDFRKVTDDINMQRPTISSQSSQILASDIPVQFAMTNEEICEEDVKIIDKDFSGSNTEAEDHALLYQIVPIDFGSRLLKL